MKRPQKHRLHVARQMQVRGKMGAEVVVNINKTMLRRGSTVRRAPLGSSKYRSYKAAASDNAIMHRLIIFCLRWMRKCARKRDLHHANS